MFFMGATILAAIVGAALILPNLAISAAVNLIASFEGFSPTPYWDVSRWSWGYGTAAPGQYGTITETAAKAQLRIHVIADYKKLKPLITVHLTTNQWAALLSFSYNLGVGNADNLIANINNGNTDALNEQWSKYIYAGGIVDSDLIARREKELSVWNS